MIITRENTVWEAKKKNRAEHINAGIYAGIFEADIQNRFIKGLNADGSKMKPLKSATVQSKLRRGSPPNPLIDTGQLVRSVRKNIISRNKAEVYIDPNRDKSKNTDILDYQEKYDRKPFGVSKDALKEIKKRNEAIKNG